MEEENFAGPKLVVGRIPFLVCAPFYSHIPDSLPGLSWVEGTPRELNLALRNGQIHTAPSSSFELGCRPHLYEYQPDMCTSGTLEIRSVKLFSQKPLRELDGAVVRLSTQSDTSVALLKVLMHKRFGLSPQWTETESPGACAQLFIGDAALQEEIKGRWAFSYDLGFLWQEWQNLPFVFALWIIRRDALAHPVLRERLNAFFVHVQNSLAQFRRDPRSTITNWNAQRGSLLEYEQALRYFSVIDYQFGAMHRKSLRLFFDFCQEMDLFIP